MFAVHESNRSSLSLEPDDAVQPAPSPTRTAEVNTVSAYPAGYGPDAAHAINHGGRILKHVDVAPVYLGSYWKTPAGASDRRFNDGAMANLVKNKGMTGLWKQYGAGAGTTHASVTIGEGNPRQMTQAQVASLVKAQIAAGNFDASKRERVFMVVLPPGCELVTNHGESSRNGLGGFHASVTVGGREVYYAVLAYPKRTASAFNGIDFVGNARDNLSIAESHEITEAVTDPDVDLAIRLHDPSKLGWYDDVTRWGYTHQGKGEIGDIPVINAQLRGDTRLRSVWGRSEGYAFQKEWSEVDGVSELAPGGR